MHIILLAGEQRAGKSTVAKALGEHYSSPIVSFSTPVWTSLQLMYPEFMGLRYETAKLLQPLRVRVLMQQTADLLKKDNQEYFLDETLKTLEFLRCQNITTVIFDDWRFDYELKVLDYSDTQTIINLVDPLAPPRRGDWVHNSDEGLSPNVLRHVKEMSSRAIQPIIEYVENTRN